MKTWSYWLRTTDQMHQYSELSTEETGGTAVLMEKSVFVILREVRHILKAYPPKHKRPVAALDPAAQTCRHADCPHQGGTATDHGEHTPHAHGHPMDSECGAATAQRVVRPCDTCPKPAWLTLCADWHRLNTECCALASRVKMHTARSQHCESLWNFLKRNHLLHTKAYAQKNTLRFSTSLAVGIRPIRLPDVWLSHVQGEIRLSSVLSNEMRQCKWWAQVFGARKHSGTAVPYSAHVEESSTSSNRSDVIK